MKWEDVPREEQETVMNIDYFEKTINVYTTRKQVAERLMRKLGEPTKILKNNNQVYGVEYTRNLYDVDVKNFFSKTLLVGSFKNANDEYDEE